MTDSSQPIGVFDSGVGGLSVLRHLHDAAPQEHLLYFADQAHVPTVRARQQKFASTALKSRVSCCGTARRSSLWPATRPRQRRSASCAQTFPDVSFVGMEPAVKPAALSTASGVVGVLATPGTFRQPALRVA